ncbi:hypothetical protein DFH28DRAFT_914914, partial [Melampsora americana]
KARSDSSKARPVTIKQRHKEKTQSSTLEKYSELSLPDLQKIAEPLGIKGSGGMRRDELLQLCLLFAPELNVSTNTSNTGVRSLRSGKNQNSDPGRSNDHPVPSRLTSRRCSTTSDRVASDKSNRSAANNPNTTARSSRSDKELCSDSAISNDDCAPCSSTSRRCSTSNNLRPLDTLTEDHEPEIEIDTEMFTTPDAQVLRDESRHNQDILEEGDERDDEGVDDRVMPLPSRGRGTALPRPRPTVLSEVSKGKRRRRSPSSDDWVPDASEQGNSPGSSSMELTGMDLDDEVQDDSRSVSGASSGQEGRRFATDDDGGARAAISRLLEARENADNTRPECIGPSVSESRNSAPGDGNSGNDQDLRRKVDDLTQLVLQLVSNPSSGTRLEPKIKKPHGSTFRARIRSHIWTMMGLKEDDEIPPSATQAQRSSWKIHTPRKSMLVPCHLDREVSSSLTSSASDPRFPFKGGPGGEYSNPQILLIMWTMMNRVGVSSFRPIWEDSPSSPENKFLWTLATSTFIHLVKAGEYDDIIPEDSKFDVVFKALKDHARCSLKRTFRQTNEWSQAKLRDHKKRGVRAGRLRTVSVYLMKVEISNEHM